MPIHLQWPVILPWFTGSAGVCSSCVKMKEGLHTYHWATRKDSPTENLELSLSRSFCFGRLTFYLQRTHTNKERPKLEQQWPHSAICVLDDLQLWVMLIKPVNYLLWVSVNAKHFGGKKYKLFYSKVLFRKSSCLRIELQLELLRHVGVYSAAQHYARTALGWCGSLTTVLALHKVGKHIQMKFVDILVWVTAGLQLIFCSLFSFFYVQSYAEDVLHNILLQSIHHHETDRKQVR